MGSELNDELIDELNDELNDELVDELVDELIERLDAELALAGLEESTTTELDDWLLLGPDGLADDRLCVEERPA